MPDDFARPLHWIARCADSACAEIAFDRDEILMRDSKRTDSPVLRFTREQWASFQAAVADGEFDRG